MQWHIFKETLKAKLSNLWSWAKAHPEVAGPALFLAVAIPFFTWVHFQSRLKEAEEKAALEVKRVETLLEYSVRAKRHWGEWKATFLPSSAKFICYHGDNHLTWDGEGDMTYDISCNIVDGKKEFSVTCDASHCYKGDPLTKEQNEAEKKLDQLKREYGGKAAHHWDEWKEKFLKDTSTVCYHGDNLANYKEDRVKPYYRISCKVGKSDKVVVCDQNHCTEGKKK